MLNENSGVIVLIASIVIIALIAVTVWLLLRLHSKIAVQKLNFLGFYSIDKDSNKRYAGFTIGNKSLNDVGLDELGIQNGKINFPFTEKYKQDNGLRKDARIVVEQRSSITFNLDCDELRSIVIENNGKKILKTLRIYAVDLTGTLFRGKVPNVRKLIVEMLTAEKKGFEFMPSAAEPAAVSAESEQSDINENKEEINADTAEAKPEEQA